MDFTTEATTGMIWKDFLVTTWEIIKYTLYLATWGLYNFRIPIVTIVTYAFWGAIALGIILGIRKGLKSAKENPEKKNKE